MELIQTNTDIPIEPNMFAWRYMNLTKLISLLDQNELYFARIDQFDDPLDSLPWQIIENINLYRISRDPAVLEEIKKYQNSKFSKSELLEFQSGKYASCWHLSHASESESLAMWNSLSDSNTLAFVIPFSKLFDIISKSIVEFKDDEISAAMYGMVKYKYRVDRAFELIENQGKQNNDRRILEDSFYKLPEYNHENELRFILKSKKTHLLNNRLGVRLKLTTPLKEMRSDISIIIHPDMEYQLSKLVIRMLAEINFTAQLSNIITKNNIKEIMTD